MSADFRALCVELTDCLEKADWPLRHRYVFRQWIDIARAALSDEPAVPQGREPASVTEQPSDEEIMGLMPQQMHEDLAYAARAMANEAGTDNRKAKGFMRIALNRHAVDLARAVLARWGNPAPAPPADGEVAELVRTLTGIAHWRRRGRPGEGDPSPFDIRQADRLDRAAELLQRQALVPPADGEVVEVVEWLHTVVAAYKRCRNTDHIWSLSGNGVNARLTVTLLTRAAELLQRQALVPVSASERLPGPEDCAPWPQPSDKSGWCWMSRTVHGFYGSFAIWEQVSVVPMCREVYTHWLPAHALPLPEVGVD